MSGKHNGAQARKLRFPISGRQQKRARKSGPFSNLLVRVFGIFFPGAIIVWIRTDAARSGRPAKRATERSKTAADGSAGPEGLHLPRWCRPASGLSSTGFQRVDHGFGEVFTGFHDRQVRTELGSLRAEACSLRFPDRSSTASIAAIGVEGIGIAKLKTGPDHWS
jgi:hypothetical protein